MKQVEWMGEFVADAIAHHVAEVKADGCIWLELSQPGKGRVLIEELVKGRQMRVAYILFDESGLPVVEPELHFHIDKDGHWLPIAISRISTGSHTFAVLDSESSEYIPTDAAKQANLANFADYFGEVLRNNGWISHSRKWVGAPSLGKQFSDENETPDIETLQRWLDDDGGCEATDGCFVEPDGICPHGHKSWLLELGLI